MKWTSILLPASKPSPKLHGFLEDGELAARGLGVLTQVRGLSQCSDLVSCKWFVSCYTLYLSFQGSFPLLLEPEIWLGQSFVSVLILGLTWTACKHLWLCLVPIIRLGFVYLVLKLLSLLCKEGKPTFFFLDLTFIDSSRGASFFADRAKSLVPEWAVLFELVPFLSVHSYFSSLVSCYTFSRPLAYSTAMPTCFRKEILWI